MEKRPRHDSGKPALLYFLYLPALRAIQYGGSIRGLFSTEIRNACEAETAARACIDEALEKASLTFTLEEINTDKNRGFCELMRHGYLKLRLNKDFHSLDVEIERKMLEALEIRFSRNDHLGKPDLSLS